MARKANESQLTAIQFGQNFLGGWQASGTCSGCEAILAAYVAGDREPTQQEMRESLEKLFASHLLQHSGEPNGE